MCYLLFWTPFFLSRVLSIHMTFWDGFLNRPVITSASYFLILTLILFFIQSVIFVKILVHKKHSLLGIMNQALHIFKAEQSTVPVKIILYKLKIYLSIFFVVYTILHLVLLQTSYPLPSRLETPENVFKRMILTGRKRFWLGISDQQSLFLNKTDNELPFSSFNMLDNVLGALEFWFTACGSTVYVSITLLCTGSLPFTMWGATRCFEEYYVTHSKEVNLDWRVFQQELIKRYEQLVMFSNSVNDVWAVPLFLWIAQTSILQMTLLHYMVESRDPLNVAEVFIEVLMFVIMLIVSGRTYKMVLRYDLS